MALASNDAEASSAAIVVLSKCAYKRCSQVDARLPVLKENYCRACSQTVALYFHRYRQFLRVCENPSQENPRSRRDSYSQLDRVSIHHVRTTGGVLED